MIHEIDVVAHNEQARAAQQYAGVDPDACIRIVEIPGGDRTSLAQYLDGLSQRQYRMPAESHERLGNRPSWREHDTDLHARRVGALHPSIVEVVESSAKKGRTDLLSGSRGDAETIADASDFALSNRSTFWESGLFELWQRLGRNPDTFPSLIEIQAQHLARLVEYNPNLFQSIKSGQRRV
jgi:hypothetical protein